MKTQSICCGLLYAATLAVPAAVPRDFVVDVKAAVSDVTPHIVLSWSQRVQSNITAQKIHRRLKGETAWVKLADLTATQTSYTDNTAATGIEYEYWMERTLTGLFPTTAIGYLSAGVKVPEVHARGTLLLLVDDTMAAPLAAEIAQLKLDLAADGWTVQTITAPRSGTAVSTKALITAAYAADPVNVKAVYLLGHVPVPYSGNQAPDGHGDHSGAWPADGYYGEMNGTWTDVTVTNETPSSTRNDNIPGDGKFDQISFPSLVELQVGRVDLHSMTKAPNSSVTETTRLRRYLQRAHAFRHKLGAYANIPRRTLIRDGFGHAFSSEPFAAAAWATAFSSVGTSITEAPGSQWFSATYAGGNDYLWGHGCGGGSYESASSFGSTDDLGRKPSRVVFTSLFGSYHGDWDAGNNLMRAAIAGNAAGDSLGLVCFWTGRPHWFMHHLGMGETMGHMARVSMNSRMTGGGSYLPSSSSERGVHIGLMGDPALRMHAVEPPRNLAATSASGTVDLTWAVSTDTAVQGYHVYRSESTAGPFTKLTASPLADTSYTDATATPGTAYTYLVRTLKLETVPGGSYYNLSVGSPVGITVNAGPDSAPPNPSELAAVHQTGGLVLSWRDNSTNETGFRIEKKTGVSGSYAPLATVGENITSHTDVGPFTHGTVYFYRVAGTGAAGDSVASLEISFEAIAGFVQFAATRMKVNKSAGTASFSIVRSGGGAGAVNVTCATSNVSALAGTHYTTTSSIVSWVDGEQGPKTFTVPVTNTAAPQLPRSFKAALSAGTGSLSIGPQSAIAVQIEDPTATLGSPWSSSVIGTPTDSSPAVFAEGILGDSTMGGSGAVLDTTAEAGRFICQSRTGDGVITMQVPTPAVNQAGARFALMVRPSATTTNAVMAATVTASSAANYGTRFVYRVTAAAEADNTPTADNNLDTPRWLRLSRFGNLFISETSADGTTWTSLGSTTISAMPAAAVWGIFHYSAAQSSATSVGDYHLATYQNVTLGNLPPPPAPTGFAGVAGAGGIALSWSDGALTETGFQIERQVANGSWAALQTLAVNSTTHTDATVLPGVFYQYRVRAISATGDSNWATASATASGTASGYRQWLLANGLPMDESGTGSATATPANDQLPNLVKYALGLPSSTSGHAGRLSSGLLPQSGADYLTFSYTCPEPLPPGISYAVETGTDLLLPGWSTGGITLVSDTVTGNLRTVVVRLADPTSTGGTHFMRLKVSQQ